MYDKNVFKYLPELQPEGNDFLAAFEVNVKKLYSGKGVLWRVIKQYVVAFILAFRDAQPKDVEFLNPSYKEIFSMNFPKLSALYSLPLYVFVSGGLAFTDASPVCIFRVLMLTFSLRPSTRAHDKHNGRRIM